MALNTVGSSVLIALGESRTVMMNRGIVLILLGPLVFFFLLKEKIIWACVFYALNGFSLHIIMFFVGLARRELIDLKVVVLRIVKNLFVSLIFGVVFFFSSSSIVCKYWLLCAVLLSGLSFLVLAWINQGYVKELLRS